MNFEVYEDNAGNARWRLIASNGQNVASSGESFASTSNAKRAAQSFKANASNAEFEVDEDQAAGSFRWRAKSSNGQIVASGGEAFSSNQSARRAADNLRGSAATATGP